MRIDPSALEPYREIMGEEADAFIAEILGMFVENAPKLVQQMEQSLAVNDNKTFTRSAHTLKSNSATVGAVALSRLAETLELEGMREDLQTLQDAVNEAKAELNLVLVDLKK